MENPSELKDVMEKELSRLLDWVRRAESRLTLVIPLSTAMLGVLSVLSPAFSKWSLPFAIAWLFAVLLLAISILSAALASFPRTRGPENSLIYFGGIIKMNPEKYGKAVRKMTVDEYVEDLIKQCHRNAQIAQSKVAWVQRSMACLLFAVLPWGISLFILYLEKR